jgi:hypothetical protein
MALPWPNDDVLPSAGSHSEQVEQGFPTMSHAGFSSSPDDGRSETESSDANRQRQPTTGARQDAACGVYHHDGEVRIEGRKGREGGTNLPIQAARADAALPNDSLPFVVQAGQIMFLVAEERDGWVLAELRFDAASCTFIEERRTRFQWPREVFGRLLSRTIVGHDFDMNEANRIADAFTRWLASQYVTSQSAR